MKKAVDVIKRKAEEIVKDIDADVPEEDRHVINVADFDDETFYLEKAVTIRYEGEYDDPEYLPNSGFEVYEYEISCVEMDAFDNNLWFDFGTACKDEKLVLMKTENR